MLLLFEGAGAKAEKMVKGEEKEKRGARIAAVMMTRIKFSVMHLNILCRRDTPKQHFHINKECVVFERAGTEDVF
jgi:hypothetical protein